MFQYFNQLTSGIRPSWIIKITTGTTSTVPLESISVDNDGNGHSGGSIAVSGNNNLINYKFSNTGELTQQKQMTVGNPNERIMGVAFDGGNIYSVGFTGTSIFSPQTNLIYGTIVSKYELDGTAIWQKLINKPQQPASGINNIHSPNKIKLLSNGDPLIVGTSRNDLYIIRINSINGNIIWQKTISNLALQNTGVDFGRSLYVDADDNIYISAIGLSFTLITAKLNSNGDVVWIRYLGNNNLTRPGGGAIVVDSTGSVYNFARDTSNSKLVIVKYTSDGTLSLQRYINSTFEPIELFDAVEKDNNIYITGQDVGQGFIIRLNANLQLQWQRRFYPINAQDNERPNWRGISIDNFAFYYICGQSRSSQWIGKFPINGTLTGTYGEYIYEAVTNYTISTSFITVPTGNFPSTTSNFDLSINDTATVDTELDLVWIKDNLGI